MKKKKCGENLIAELMAKGQYPDLSNLSDFEKKRVIEDFTIITSKYFLYLFLTLGMKTHIETMVINDKTGQEYILSFKTVEKYKADLHK
jgi:hypothetical protein